MPSPRETSEHWALLSGHLVEWGELLERLAARRGLTVLVADPLSGTSGLLAAALKEDGGPHVIIDARRCATAADLAMAIGDGAVASFAPRAYSWWSGDAPPQSTDGLAVYRALTERGIDVVRLRFGEGPAQIATALELADALAGGPFVLAIDHIGAMLASLRDIHARQILEAIRTASQRLRELDLLLVDHPHGPVTRSLDDPDHPMLLAGERLSLTRPTPDRIVEDLNIVYPRLKVPRARVKVAAELAAGVPSLTWQVVRTAPEGMDPAPGALAAWQSLRELNATSTCQQWDVLRRVHPAAHTVLAAIALGIKPYAAPLASKTVDAALNRLRDVGVVWQPAPRSWALADPLLGGHAREYAPPWAMHRSAGRSSSSEDPAWTLAH